MVAINLWKAKMLVKARRAKLKINLRSIPRIVKFVKNQKQRSNDQDGQLLPVGWLRSLKGGCHHPIYNIMYCYV
jgi:hypothetical protein